jgi:hypothetical protein
MTRRFKNLNVEPLRRLGISNILWSEAKGLMDLALKSSCSKIDLEMHNDLPSIDPLTHKLMERVEHLEFSAREQNCSRCGEILTQHDSLGWLPSR